MSKRDLTVAEFCDRHDACSEGCTWALANCKTMREAWDTAKPEWVLWIATRPGVLPDRTIRLLAVQFARTVEHLTTDERSRNALNVAERHANGQATDEELAAARDAASAAASAAARAAASAATWAAAWDAAWAAAWDAARAAASAAAWDAAWDAFAKMIRQHEPNLTGGAK